MSPIPVQSRIHPDQLNNQSVEFTIPTEHGQVTGFGRFEAHHNSNGFDYIDLIHTQPIADLVHRMRYHLSQELVDLIQARPEADGFTLAACAR
jgi:hypothetical protein